jgi:hypothetical protein
LLPTRRSLAAAFALLLCVAPTFAANPVTITGVSVGLPTPGNRPVDRDDPGIAKFAAWAPVYVTLDVTGQVSEPAELVIEAPDADELITTLSIPIDLTGVSPGTKVFAPDRGALGYVRPAGANSEVAVTLRTKSGAALSEPRRVRLRPREPLQYVVLALGGAPAAFELPKPATGGDVGPLRAGRIELAHVATFDELPDQWFGYETADLAILNTATATDDFLRKLFASDAPTDKRKREALTEWVRRGGRLAISVGEKAAFAAQLPGLKALLPYAIKPGAPARTESGAVSLFWSAGQSSQTNVLSGPLGGGQPFPMANLIPNEGRAARVVIPPASRQSGNRETVAAQSAFGLGRVTVIGFDLDREPFASFPQRREFWDWVLRDCGASRASAGGEGKPRPPGALTEDEDEAAVAIRQHNDTFEGVPVVSFGWVAMLIALYILLIGPLEYYFLKRILGRLELTWVTFPVIALTVCALSYFSADAIKGRELRVNKLDVVDVDSASEKAFCTTWFTVFSPRIDTYTIGVDAGDWGYANPEQVTTTWSGAPRGGRPGLLRRKYAIQANQSQVGSGLENVPIQVWSTKAFSANWAAPIDLHDFTHAFQKPVMSDLTHPPGDPTKVVGTFRHNLPVPVLTDCVAFYAGMAYPLPGEVIVRGEPVRFVFDQGTPASQWLQANGKLDALLGRVQSYAERPGQKLSQKQQLQALAGPLPMWGVLFHEAALKSEEGVIARNASLRRLDQSWRLSPDDLNEVIVVGRAVPQYGPAEEVLTGPNSPSKLWLKGLPGRDERQPIKGVARQETWVRFYLPVK